MLNTALDVLNRLYKPGYQYKKAGVMLTGIIPEADVNYDLFRPSYPDSARQRVMAAVDEINRRHGMNTLQYGSMGWEHVWRMNQNSLSPKYTTRWDELPKVKG
jgi:DNA polymerase V